MPSVCAICLSHPKQPARLFNNKNKTICSHSYCSSCISKWATKETTCPQCKRVFNGYGCCKKIVACRTKFQRRKQFLFRICRFSACSTQKRIIAQGNSLLYYLLTQKKARVYFQELINAKNETAIKFLKGHIVPCLKKTNLYYNRKYQCGMDVDFPVFSRMVDQCLLRAQTV